MRKNKYMKRIVSAVLLASVTLSLSSCGIVKEQKASSTGKVRVLEPMEIEEVATYSLDAIGGSDVMPIAGYFAPYTPSYSYNGNQQPDQITDEVFKRLAECGINFFTLSNANYTANKDQIIKALELGEKYGIAVLVEDRRLTQENLPIEMVDAYINEYANYSSFGGIYIVDEPGTSYFRNRPGVNIDDFVHVAQYANELDVFGYHNLFPTMRGNEEAYEQYIQEFVDKFNPKYVQYDIYPFNSGLGQDVQMLFSNISSVYKIVSKANIPAWAFIQAGGQFNDARDFLTTNQYSPTKGEFFWDIGTRLAFGAKGIHYFPVIQPYWFGYASEEPFDFQRSGLLGAWGNTTRWYYYAQEINQQIAAVDHVLMNAQHKGVIAVGNSAKSEIGADNSALMKEESWRELEKAYGDAIIGCFNYKGKTALYVVNQDREYAQEVTLDLIDTFEFTVIQDAVEKKMTADSIKLTFSAGNSALIVFE